MDFDSFFASPRWEILQRIAENPSSPIEIAKEISTTVSYVSQQLKLLEAAGLVVKKRTGAVERGKPRTIFSISKDFLYLTVLTKKFSQKKLIPLTEHHKISLKIWVIPDESLHYPLERFFWHIETNLKEIEGIFIDFNTPKNKLILVSESKKIKSKIESAIKKLSDKFTVSFVSLEEFSKLDEKNLHNIHASQEIVNTKELKGGKK